MDTTAETELLRFFSALADERSLRIAGHLVEQEATIPELATDLGIRPQVVTRHLSTLADAGLVSSTQRDGRTTWTLDIDALRDQRKRLLARDRTPSPADDPGTPDWNRAVLGNFFDGKRLKEIPANPKKRQVILAWLVERFDRDTRYPEREVNEIIKKHHPDSAALRRELIDHGYMQRADGVYWRVEREHATQSVDASAS